MAQQIVKAFPFETAPNYLLCGRDGIYRREFRHRVTRMGIEQMGTAPRSTWQNPYVERLIGSVRRECIDHGQQSPLASSARHVENCVEYPALRVLRWKTSRFPAALYIRDEIIDAIPLFVGDIRVIQTAY